MKIAIIVALVVFLVVMIFILHTISCVRDTREDLEQEEFIKNYVKKMKE